MKYRLTVIDCSAQLSGDQTLPGTTKVDVTITGQDAGATAHALYKVMREKYINYCDLSLTYEEPRPSNFTTIAWKRAFEGDGKEIPLPAC